MSYGMTVDSRILVLAATDGFVLVAACRGLLFLVFRFLFSAFSLLHLDTA
jgi:hypothetical protein